MAGALLEIKHLYKRFGALEVTRDLSLEFSAGELRCIIGPNGAGKTTLFNLITGSLKPDQGQIIFNGREISHLKPHEISRAGIVRKFQVPTVFGELSVMDNLGLAALGDQKLSALALSNSKAIAVREEVFEVLELIGLAGKGEELAGNLSHGQKQWLEIGMALARRPRLMLLDEPTAGMSPQETMQTSHIITKIAQQTTTVVIEHDIKFLKEIGQHVTVLHQGGVLMDGTFEEVEGNQIVRDVYLGRR